MSRLARMILKLSTLPRILISARPYSRFQRKSRLFHNLAEKTSMFFSSRINAAHSRVIGHAVNRQHVSSRSSVNRMGICVPAKVIETCDHRVVQPLVYHIFAPE